MNSAEFASVYTRQLDPVERRSGELPQIMSASREWSHQFGEILHDELTSPGEADPQKFAAMFVPYMNWTVASLQKLNVKLWEQGTPEAYDALNELNFHNLNAIMAPVWPTTLFENYDAFNGKQSRLMINNAKNKIALSGLAQYAFREKLTNAPNDYTYFSSENRRFRDAIEGILNEHDAALVLLEISQRNPGTHVVPAPMQFEHGKIGRYNSDFVVIRNKTEAIGAQVKSSVKSMEQLTRYDSSRVMLIDADTDFGNSIARRITPGKSNISHITWAGILCAQRVNNIPTHGPDANLLAKQGADMRFIVMHKMIARRMLHGIKPNFNQAVNVVSDRITHALNPDKSASA